VLAWRAVWRRLAETPRSENVLRNAKKTRAQPLTTGTCGAGETHASSNSRLSPGHRAARGRAGLLGDLLFVRAHTRTQGRSSRGRISILVQLLTPRLQKLCENDARGGQPHSGRHLCRTDIRTDLQPRQGRHLCRTYAQRYQKLHQERHESRQSCVLGVVGICRHLRGLRFIAIGSSTKMTLLTELATGLDATFTQSLKPRC